MLRSKVAVDLGTAYSMLATTQDSSFIQMPSCVLVSTDTDEVLHYGDTAKAQTGRCAQNLEVRFPIQKGVVCDFDLTEKLLKKMISSKKANTFGFAKEIYVCAPWCSTAAELKAYEAFLEDEDKKIVIVREPYAAAIGLGWQPESLSAVTIMDLGGGSVEVSSLQSEFIFSVHSLKQAGQHCDSLIQDYFKKQHQLEIGALQAEFLKINCLKIGGAWDKQEYSLAGFDRQTKSPRKIQFSGAELSEAIQPFLEAVLDLVETHISVLSEPQQAQLEADGLWLSGGTSLLGGIEGWLQQQLQIPVIRANNPQQSVIKGMRQIMRKPRKFRPILDISNKVCPS